VGKDVADDLKAEQVAQHSGQYQTDPNGVKCQ